MEAQSCEEISKELSIVQDQFTKLKLSEAKHLHDSLLLLVPQFCDNAMMYSQIIQARIGVEEGNLKASEANFRKALVHANMIQDVVLQKHILALISIIAGKREDYEGAIAVLDSAFQITCPLDSLKCYKQNVRIKINQGVSLKILSRYADALECYTAAHKLIKEYNLTDSIYEVAILNALGNIYQEQFGDDKQALDYYIKAKNICPKKNKAMFLLYNNIGNRFVALNEFDSARYYFNTTITKVESARYKVTPYQGLGDISLKESKFNEAISNYQFAIDNSIATNNSSNIYYSKSLLAKAYFLSGEHLKSSKIFKEVLRHFDQADIEGFELKEIKTYYFANEVALRDNKLGIEYFNFLAGLDSIQNAEKITEINEAVIRYEKLALQDSLQNEMLIKENLEVKNSRYLIGLLCSAFGLILTFLSLKWLSDKYNAQKKINNELVFENQEILDLNKTLATKIEDLKDSNPKESLASSKLKFKSRDKIYTIALDQIIYLSAEGNGTRIYCSDQNYWSDNPLKKIHSEISDDQFLKIFRSTIVNVRHVVWVNHSSLKLQDGTELKIGRTYKESIREAINLS